MNMKRYLKQLLNIGIKLPYYLVQDNIFFFSLSMANEKDLKPHSCQNKGSLSD